jgi:hypothetical protein
LDPHRDGYERMTFAVIFAARIILRDKPSAALTNACNEMFDQNRADKIKEKTLRSWLCAEFGVKRWPRTNGEWQPIVREHYASLDKFFLDYARRISGNNLGKNGS